MRTLLVIISFIFTLELFADMSELEQKQYEQRNKTTVKEIQEKTTQTFKQATGSEDVKNYNAKDWQGYFEKNGANDGIIGNTISLFGKQKGAGLAASGNPNELSSESLRSNDLYKNEPSIKVFNGAFQADIIAKATSNGTTKVEIDSTVKCYITRELPIRYKCPKTGITYGDDMNGNGGKAKVQCDTECYEQYSCVSLVDNPILDIIEVEEMELTDAIQTIEKEVLTSSEVIVDTFTAKINNPNDGINFVDILAVKNDDTTVKIVSSLRIVKENELILPIKMVVKKFIIKYYSDNLNSTGKITDIKINFIPNGKYICPKNQDISTSNPGTFAYLCPSGNINTFNVLHSTYKICADYGMQGDNIDGTFSSIQSCNAECKENFSCSLDYSTVNTDVLTNFREGCIEGQANCEPDTCKKLRLQKALVLNENVFDASQKLTKTVINGNQVQGVKRPRVLLRDDLSYQERLREELKDESYEYMLDKKNYTISSTSLAEDTQSSSAFNIGIKKNTINGVQEGILIRSLLWVLKPAAFEVNDGNYKMYAIVEAIVEETKVDIYGKKYISKDKIFYIRTSENDTFKPFAIKRKFAKIGDDGEEAEEISSQWSYESFNTSTNKWFTHSSSLTAEYFINEEIVMDAPQKRIEVVSKMNELLYNLPGLVRNVEENGPYITLKYDGRFTGKGQSIGRYSMFVFYSKNETPTYQEFVEKIDNDEMEKIYSITNPDLLSQTVMSDDGKRDGNVEIFTFGKVEQKTGYLRIRPKKEDVGKKGHIFVFAY